MISIELEKSSNIQNIMSYNNIFVTRSKNQFRFENGFGTAVQVIEAENVEAALASFKSQHPEVIDDLIFVIDPNIYGPTVISQSP